MNATRFTPLPAPIPNFGEAGSSGQHQGQPAIVVTINGPQRIFLRNWTSPAAAHLREIMQPQRALHSELIAPHRLVDGFEILEDLTLDLRGFELCSTKFST